MRVENLKSPGAYSNSQHLRVEAAKAISFVEIQKDKLGAGNPAGDGLAAFFDDCRVKAAAAAAAPADPVLPATQAIVKSTVAVSGIVCSGALTGTNAITFTVVDGVITAASIA